MHSIQSRTDSSGTLPSVTLDPIRARRRRFLRASNVWHKLFRLPPRYDAACAEGALPALIVLSCIVMRHRVVATTGQNARAAYGSNLAFTHAS